MKAKILGIIKESIVFPMNYVLSLFWFIPLRPKLQKGKPILLIHGYLNSAFVWFYFKRKLEKEGFGPIFTQNLGVPFYSLQTFAKRVKAKLEKEGALLQENEWICIGHSMGGLVAALYEKDYAANIHFSHIITLGSPFQGTNMTALGLGKCTMQMRRNSPLLQELRVWMDSQKEVVFYTMASRIDHIIIPHESAIWGKNFAIMDNVGHGSMLFSKEAEERVVLWLKAILNRP